jgi:hypothetical protein
MLQGTSGTTTTTTTANYTTNSNSIAMKAIGDIRLVSRDKIIVCSQGNVFIPPLCRRMIKYRCLYDGICIQNQHATVAERFVNLSIYTIYTMYMISNCHVL